MSGVGVFSARYGPDGTLARQTLPGAPTSTTGTASDLIATTVSNAARESVVLGYAKAGADWLTSTATFTAFGQVGSYQTLTPTGTGGAPVGTRSAFSYDGIGRLTKVVDTANGSTAACTRNYTFDINSNRKTLTQTATAGAPAGTCPTSVAASDSYAYDTADRLQPGAVGTPRASLRYDQLGRTRTLPSVDTVDKGGDVTIGVYVDDLVVSLKQGARTSGFVMDAGGRRVLRTDTVGPSTSASTVTHYTADDDNPDSVTEPGGSITRNVTGLGPLAAVATGSPSTVATAPAVTLQLANLHGDIAATVPAGATSPTQLTVTETTEFGLPRTQPAASSLLPRYGWLGTHQRDASTPGGLTLMGARLYNPVLGRFLSVDPVEGGGANTYDYTRADPVGNVDLDGRANIERETGGGQSRGYIPIVQSARLTAIRSMSNKTWQHIMNRHVRQQRQFAHKSRFSTKSRSKVESLIKKTLQNGRRVDKGYVLNFNRTVGYAANGTRQTSVMVRLDWRGRIKSAYPV